MIRKYKSSENSERSKGITLIALIITIILLLILASITIVQIEKNELFEKTKEAKQKYANAEELENSILEYYDMQISEIEKNLTNANVMSNVDTNKTKPQNAMPKGATVIQGDGNRGIVIKDKNNNYWTWVEVPKTIFIKTTSEFDYNNIIEDLKAYTKEYKTKDWIDEWYDGCGIVATEDKTAIEVYTQMYNKMLKSIYINGGFYISTYEIGDNTATKNNTVRTGGILGTPVSQANQIPYNFVTCSEAQGLASGMSTDTAKISSLLFGTQWDLVCKFLEEKKILQEIDIKKDSTNWGNFSNKELEITSMNAKQLSSIWTSILEIKPASGILLTTGASEETNKMNIYDLAGNLWEWTLEKSNWPCVFRGGSYKFTGTNYTANERNCHGAGYNSYDDVGFRATLYDK